nr:MAG TPA: hypothetical protein [Caudoviricetes sp.]
MHVNPCYPLIVLHRHALNLSLQFHTIHKSR